MSHLHLFELGGSVPQGLRVAPVGQSFRGSRDLTARHSPGMRRGGEGFGSRRHRQLRNQQCI